jgi:hypothetical protein
MCSTQIPKGLLCVFSSAGQASGDSLGAVMGAVLYDLKGIRAAYSTQSALLLAALLALISIAVWQRCAPCLSCNGNKSETSVRHVLASGEKAAANGRVQSTTTADVEIICSVDKADANSDDTVAVRDVEAGTFATGKPLGKLPGQQTNAALSRLDDTTPGTAGRLIGKSLNSNAIMTSVMPPAEGARILEAADDDTMDTKIFIRHTPDKNYSGHLPDGIQAAQLSTAKVLPITSEAKKPTLNPTPDTSEPDQASPGSSVWHLLKQRVVVCECVLAFFAEMLRAVVDVLLPLAMYTTSTWLVGVIYLGGAAGALIAPFLLDILLAKHPNVLNSCHLQSAAVFVMCTTAPSLMLLHLSVPGAFVVMFCFGAAHSLIQALVLKHLVDHVGSEEPAALNACMSAFSLFYVLGFTVGSLIAGVPSHQLVLDQQLATAAVAAAMLVYMAAYQGKLHRAWGRVIAACGKNTQGG